MKMATGKIIHQTIYYKLFEVLLAVFSSVCITLLIYNIVYALPIAIRYGFSFTRIVTSLAAWIVISGVATYAFYKVLMRGLAKAACRQEEKA